MRKMITALNKHPYQLSCTNSKLEISAQTFSLLKDNKQVFLYCSISPSFLSEIFDAAQVYIINPSKTSFRLQTSTIFFQLCTSTKTSHAATTDNSLTACTHTLHFYGFTLTSQTAHGQQVYLKFEAKTLWCWHRNISFAWISKTFWRPFFNERKETH